MAYKYMWAIEIYNNGETDIHGIIYGENYDDIVMKLKEIVPSDCKKLDGEYPWTKFNYRIVEPKHKNITGIFGHIRSEDQVFGWEMDPMYAEVDYRICKRKVPV